MGGRLGSSVKYQTGDTHPMHMHLVTFQVIGRTPFDAEAYEEANDGAPYGVPGGIDPTPFATGPTPPTRARGTWFQGHGQCRILGPRHHDFREIQAAKAGSRRHRQKYVYHCHIVEHEDNDMMRPFTGNADNIRG